MPSSPLFTRDALASLKQAQTDAMPNQCFVLRATVTHDPGAVARQTWAVARVFPCRITRSTANERDDDTGRRGVIGVLLTYPMAQAPLDGTEIVIVVSDGSYGDAVFRRAFRIVGAHQERSFAGSQQAILSDDDIPPDIDPDDFVP